MKIKLSLILSLTLTFTAFLSFSQNFVSTLPENKNVVLEQFTGIYCGFCPDGHVIAEGLQASNPNDVFISKIQFQRIYFSTYENFSDIKKALCYY